MSSATVRGDADAVADAGACPRAARADARARAENARSARMPPRDPSGTPRRTSGTTPRQARRPGEPSAARWAAFTNRSSQPVTRLCQNRAECALGCAGLAEPRGRLEPSAGGPCACSFTQTYVSSHKGSCATTPVACHPSHQSRVRQFAPRIMPCATRKWCGRRPTFARGAVRLDYRSRLAFELEPDPLFGQLCGVAVPLCGVLVVDEPVLALGRFDFEWPLAAANATPPPASEAVATASARMRVAFLITASFRRWRHESSRT